MFRARRPPLRRIVYTQVPEQEAWSEEGPRKSWTEVLEECRSWIQDSQGSYRRLEHLNRTSAVISKIVCSSSAQAQKAVSIFQSTIYQQPSQYIKQASRSLGHQISRIPLSLLGKVDSILLSATIAALYCMQAHTLTRSAPSLVTSPFVDVSCQALSSPQR